VSAIDSRIVQLRFDNKDFEQNVSRSINSLDKLNKSLDMPGAKKGLSDVQSALSGMNFGPLQTSVEGVSAKFLALGTVAVATLANIVNRAAGAGIALARSLTLDPITTGLREYETNLNSIQTILANTQASGATLSDVSAALDELNEYSDKTIYNFSEMARNIGTFTAAGVNLKTSTDSIKGIANLAALSGSNSQQAATAMYQLSQAISAGKVSLMDWNSVVNAGMGGTVFQRALAETAVAMGKLSPSAVKLTGDMKNVSIAGESFRESISAGPGKDSWLTSDVLTTALSTFTGDLSDAELAAIGFNQEQIKAYQAQAATATDAATKVKTLSQLLEVAKETAGSGWSKTWRLIFGDFEEAKDSFTGLSNVINGFINGMSDARNSMLESWKGLGGRDVAIDAITKAFEALMSVLKPIKDAFREIFPAKTGLQLYNLTVQIRDFFASLKLGEDSAENLKRTFAGFFALLDIGKEILGGVFSVLGKVFGAVGEGSGGILSITAKIGDFVVSLRDAIKEGDIIAKVFSVLGDILSAPIKLLGMLGEAIGNVFNGKDTTINGVADAFGRVGDRLDGLAGLIENIKSAFRGFVEDLSDSSTFAGKLVQGLKDAFSGIGDAIAESMSSGNFDKALDALNTALFGGIVLLIRKFVNNGLKIEFGGGFLESIGESFGALTGYLKAMQQQVQSKTLLTIAIAIGILTASVLTLSLIDSEALGRSLGAMAGMFTQLMIAMGILSKISGTAGFLKIPALSLSLILLSGALLIMSFALAKLGELDWGEIGKGLTATAGMILLLTVAVKPLQASAGGLIQAAFALGAFSLSLILLAGALKILNTMDLGEVGFGLLVVGAALGVIGGAMRLMPNDMALKAASLILIGVALNILALAIKTLGGMELDVLARGIGAIAASLVIIGVAIRAMPSNMLKQAIGLAAVGGALLIIAQVLESLGGMSPEEVATSLITLAISLGILAGAMKLMQSGLVGAAAMLVMAAALAIFVPVLKILGAMPIGDIVKGLVALVAVFVILGAAGYLLAPVIPVIIGLGIAVGLIGAGLALAGLGVLAFVTAITAIIAIAGLGAAALNALLQTVADLIPSLMNIVGQAIVGLARTIAETAPEVVAAIVAVLVALMDAIVVLIPKVLETLGKLRDAFLKFLVDSVPKFVDAGYKMIAGVLKGIADNIYRVVSEAVRIVTEFLRAIGDQAPKIADEGAKTIIKFVNGLSAAIDKNSGPLGEAGGKLAVAIVKGLASGLTGGVGQVAKAVSDLAGGAISKAKSILGIKSPSKVFAEIGKFSAIGMANGLIKYKDIVGDSAAKVGDTAVDEMRNSISRLSSVMDKDIDVNPTIAPVLDLDSFRKDANKIRDILAPEAIRLNRSQLGANSVSGAVDASKVKEYEEAQAVGAAMVQFNQYNTSPKALSAIEIYRQTRNQLSVVKGGLPTG
jgi:tape measure domain-containing protein